MITKIAILQDRPYQEVVDEAVNECMGTTNKLLDVLEAKLSRLLTTVEPDACEVSGCEEPVSKDGLCYAHHKWSKAASAG